MAEVHHQVYHAPMRITYIASVAVSSDIETQTWMPIVMEWASAFMPHNLHPQSLGYHLNRSAVELCYLPFFNHI